MTVANQETGISFREWVQEHPFAALLGALLIGLFAGSTLNQVVSQSQIGSELVRLTDQCQDSTVAVRQLTRLEPSVDGTRSLLARLQQTELELDAGVQSLEGIRDLGQDLAEVRRDLTSVNQSTEQIGNVAGEIELNALRALDTTHATSVRMQELEHLTFEQQTHLPAVEQTLLTFLGLLRQLDEQQGTMQNAGSSIRSMLESQERLSSLIREVESALNTIQKFEPGLAERIDQAQQTLVSTEAFVNQADRVQQQLLDAQQDQQRAARNLHELLGVAELLAASPSELPSSPHHDSTSQIPDSRHLIPATPASNGQIQEIDDRSTSETTIPITSRLIFESSNCESADDCDSLNVGTIRSNTSHTSSLSSRRNYQQR